MNKNGLKGAERFTYGAAKIIIKFRFAVFALFITAAVYCVASLGKVRINSDLTSFLPADSETRRGIVVMQDEFVTYATAYIMLEDVSASEAYSFAEELKRIDRVSDAAFDETENHYKDGDALITISFDGAADDPEISGAMSEVRAAAEKYRYYTSTMIGRDFQKQLADEMAGVILIAALVILAVLLLTSRSYFEVAIFAMVFVFAALLNLGTNHWLGEISSITNSVAVILQLALAIDYAIIFAHRYQDELLHTGAERDALTNALAKSIVEISSSALTTVSGLAALTLMQFRLGYDLGIVLSKGIVCSMLTVFLLMPGLISLFPKLLKLTSHRRLIPNIEKWGKLLNRSKFAFIVLFALIIPFAVYFSSNAAYAFSDSGVSEIIHSDQRYAMRRINESFSHETAIALIVPNGDYEKERALLEDVSKLKNVKSALGLANVEFAPGMRVTDSFTPEQLAGLLNVDAESAGYIFTGYALEKGDYAAIANIAEYKAPLIDIAVFLFGNIDEGLISLDAKQSEALSKARSMLQRVIDQLCGKKHDRLVITSSLPVEGDDSVALVENIRAAAKKYYNDEDILVVGDITSARDLRESYNGDSVLIRVLTVLFVLIILLFTFKSFAGAAILVFVIQGSIWINFSFPFLLGSRPSFVTDMIVSAIQMGATIDYAIVLLSRYMSLREKNDSKRSMILAVNECFPTVVTSGTIMTVAGLLIAFRISDVYVGHIGLAVGRGALISVMLVLTVLPQLIVLFDKAIYKTRFRLRRHKQKEESHDTGFEETNRQDQLGE